jgi:hypothetical protein
VNMNGPVLCQAVFRVLAYSTCTRTYAQCSARVQCTDDFNIHVVDISFWVTGTWLELFNLVTWYQVLYGSEVFLILSLYMYLVPVPGTRYILTVQQ